MTEHQVMTMHLGEELDELVSTYVFGIDMVADVPYSTNIVSVWEVVDAMKKKYLKFILATEDR